MIIGKETAIGPSLRVLRHFTERKRCCQIKFDSGERAIVLLAGMPAPSVELVRLVLGGVIPWQTVWEYNPTRAGGYGDYIQKVKAMFSAPTADDFLHHMRDALLPCRSIKDARMLLLERERLADSSTIETVDGFMRHEPESVPSDDDWELGTPAPQNGSPKRAEISAIPDRYRIKKVAQGRVLTCVEAPTVTVRAVRGAPISAKQARRSSGTIFLDGAAEGDPFVDVKKEVYNLDHPEGCIRSLATCEQAIILVRKDLDLRKRGWMVLANDPDLDTILAVWILLNHLRLRGDSEVRAKIMPLLRLEGILDVHGRGLQDLAALAPDLFQLTSAMLKSLRQQDNVLSCNESSSEIDLLEYIADRLRAVDELIYLPEDFAGTHEIDELARAEIANGSVAVACRSDAGMDEVERQLQTVYGERLGVLVFENAPSTYRMRHVGRMLPATLEQAYERLNLLDPAVRGGSQNRWGGSAEIGNSPRKTGTGLVPSQIVEAIREAFRGPSLTDVVSEIPRAVFLAVAASLPALALIFGGNLLRDRGFIAGKQVLLSAVVFTVTVGVLFWLKARRVPGLYGWRAPTGFGWLTVFPAAIIGAAIGGVWAPGSLGYRMGPPNQYEFTASAALLLPVAAELFFRGVILGNLAARLPLQKSSGAWWGSWPTLLSSVLYAAASLFLFLSFSNGQIILSQCFVIVAGALTFAVASGKVRERSESILPSVLLHWLCAAALLVSGNVLF